MALQGSIGYAGSQINFSTPQSINLTMPANTYPNGTLTFDNIGSNTKWYNKGAYTSSINVYLCDSAGNNRAFLFTITLMAGRGDETTKSATVSGATGLTGKALYLIAEVASGAHETSVNNIQLRNATNITVNTALLSHTITCSAGTGGTLTASAASAAPGTTITLYPSPSTGYQLSGYTTNPSTTITNNKFTMPSSNITITATFTKITYTISKAASPAAGGTVTTGANSATMGTSVSVSQTANTGYYFNGWTTSPALTISGGAFTMPASNVSITANYLWRSTGSLNTATLTGGGSATLTITRESAAYTHKYKLSFGGSMDTGWVNVAAGTTSVSISIPIGWCSSVTSATTKTGGTLQLQTYSGSTLIGTYTISSLTFAVPASVVPSLSNISTAIARTIGGTTYANIGDIYAQSHCGVRIQASASGSYSSSITSLGVSLSGYSGSNYAKTVSSGSIDFTTGLLTIAGNITITITATDSRGRTTSATRSITVTAYAAPTGSLSVRRVDSGGSDDPNGTYGKYTLSASYSAIGSNSLTKTLRSQNTNYNNPASSGDLLPGNRQTFNILQEYTVTLTLTDSFETTVITAKVRSGRFIIHVPQDGTKLGFMKAATKSVPSGKTSVIEFSDDTQIYIGDVTLEQYIHNVMGS